MTMGIHMCKSYFFPTSSDVKQRAVIYFSKEPFIF